MALIDRFLGDAGRSVLIEELAACKVVERNSDLASEIADTGELLSVPPTTLLIQQEADDNDVYLILAGTCDIEVNGRRMQVRGPGDHVGEMAAIQPSQPRSASVIAREELVVVKLSATVFAELAGRHSHIYRATARELARRLLQRNATIGMYRQRVRIFIISSVESLGVARTIQLAFEHDPFDVVIWTDGVFKVANYTLETLEEQVDGSDFAIAIAHSDDQTESRGTKWPSPRDNVVFELGLFMGRLGRKRAILMEPRDEDIKLPSDFAGVTTIPYRYEPGAKGPSLMGPACTRLRNHILELGPNNA